MSTTTQVYLERLLAPFIEDWLDENLRTALWTPDEFKRKFSQRSVHQLLKDKDTSFLGPCLDRTLLTQWYLQLAGHDPTLFLEYLDDHNNGREGVHYFLRQGNHIIDFRHRTDVHITPVPYENPQAVTSKKIWALHGRLDPSKNFFENYQHHGVVRELHRRLPEYIDNLLRDNTPEQRRRYEQEVAHQPHLTINPTQTYINLH